MQVELKKENIEAIMLHTNRSLSDLAKEMDTSPSYITKIFNGDRKPTPKFRAKLMEVLQEEWDDLFKVVEDVTESSQPMPV